MADYPSTLVLIICRVVLGEPDVNSQFTGWRPTEPDMSQGVMHCRRHEIELYDVAVDQGAAPQPFNPQRCMREAMMKGPQFDADRAAKEKDWPAGTRSWRFWRSACPTPIYPDADANGQPDRGQPPIAYKIPECPASKGVLECEADTSI